MKFVGSFRNKIIFGGITSLAIIVLIAHVYFFEFFRQSASQTVYLLSDDRVIEEISAKGHEKNISLPIKSNTPNSSGSLLSHLSPRLRCIEDMRNEYRRIVGKYIQNRRPILLDIVWHWNLGDTFIQVGEMKYLEEAGYPLKAMCVWNACNHSALREVIDKSDIPVVILMNGGGNTGDLWRSHATFKNKVAKLYPDVPIVVLPQTIFYRNMSLASIDGEDFRKHGNLTILVRDNASLNVSRQVYNVSTELCPDAAFMIGPIDGSDVIDNCSTVYDFVVIERRDHEARGSESKNLTSALLTLKSENFTYLHIDWFSWKRFIGSRVVPRDILDQAKVRLEVGIEMLCQGNVVLTNRLHATILATLMGKPHVFVDTKFKKISNFRNAFFSSRPHCGDEFLKSKMASDWNEVVLWGKKLLNK